MHRRIISLAPSNTEILYALGAEDKIVACTRYCDFPADAKKKPRIGGWLDINDELVKKFEPDLILTSTFVQNEITDRYKKSKMNIVALMPTTLKGVFDSILKIGLLVDKEKEAKELADSMKVKINEIENKVDNKIQKYNKRNTITINSIKNKNNFKNKKTKPRIYIE